MLLLRIIKINFFFFLKKKKVVKNKKKTRGEAIPKSTEGLRLISKNGQPTYKKKNGQPQCEKKKKRKRGALRLMGFCLYNVLKI
jgi:DNA replication initiation complex subunit (GINS family)